MLIHESSVKNLSRLNVVKSQNTHTKINQKKLTYMVDI